MTRGVDVINNNNPTAADKEEPVGAEVYPKTFQQREREIQNNA